MSEDKPRRRRLSMKHESHAYVSMTTDRDLIAKQEFHPNGSRKDCAVRALALVAGLSYHEAHELYRLYGRKNGKGTPRALTAAVLAHFGAVEVKVPAIYYTYSRYYRYNRRTGGGTWCQRRTVTGGITVAQFAKLHPAGRYWCCSSGHAFAVIDGVVHDYRAKPTAKVRGAWKLTVTVPRS